MLYSNILYCLTTIFYFYLVSYILTVSLSVNRPVNLNADLVAGLAVLQARMCQTGSATCGS